MTAITIDRAVVEQALEALLKSHTCPLLPDDCEEAITALRAALAQPQGRKTGKPKNATTRLGVVCFEAYARSYVGSNRWDIAAEAVRAALAQQAEPVASGCRVMVCGVDCHPGDQHCNNYCTGKADDPPAATTEQAAAFAAKQHRERPSCDECGKSKEDGWALYCVGCLEKAFAPPQRKPLTVTKGLPRKLPEDNDE